MTFPNSATFAPLIAVLIGSCLGCEASPGFYGMFRPGPGKSYDTRAQLPSSEAWEQPRSDGKRLIVLDLHEPKSDGPTLLVLMIPQSNAGWSAVRIGHGDSEAWLLDPRPSAHCNQPLYPSDHPFFEAFAADSPSGRAAVPHCTRLAGVVELDSKPVDLKRFAVRVSLASETPASSIDGWFSTSIVPHPERAVEAMELIPYLMSGAPPL